MRVDGAPGQHLTYCTNVHPGESWPETRANLGRYLPAIKEQLSPREPFGVGLRLSAAAAQELNEPQALGEAVSWLRDQGLYVFTLNGFPFGDFHGRPVKESVYRPDWRSEQRLAYTDLLADLLVRLLPAGMSGSISTVPVAFRRSLRDESEVEPAAERLLRHVSHLVEIERRTGCHLALALEPEPCCYLETIAETVQFFERRLLAPPALGRLAVRAGLADAPQAEAAVRRHLGVCLDLCHAAVEFESPVDSLRSLRAAGIAVPKVQLSAGLRLPQVGGDAIARLRAFDDGVFLHQVVERVGDELRRYEDLGQAFESFAQSGGEREWRVHFHVPIFRADLDPFGTTRDFVEAVLQEHRRAPVSDHLEVETYTFGVLPEQYRGDDIVTSIVRELRWAGDRLRQ